MKEGSDAPSFTGKAPQFDGKASTFARKSLPPGANVESTRRRTWIQPGLVMCALEGDRVVTSAGAGLHHLVLFYIDCLYLFLVIELREKMANSGNGFR
jgi:hypothetical protein